MSQPYPTIEEVEKRVGRAELYWDRVMPDTLIRHICDLDRERQNCQRDQGCICAPNHCPWRAEGI